MSGSRDSDHRRFSRDRRDAVVIGRWGDDTVLLRLDDGKTVEAPVPEELRKRFEVGDAAVVELREGRLVAWELATPIR